MIVRCGLAFVCNLQLLLICNLQNSKRDPPGGVLFGLFVVWLFSWLYCLLGADSR